jgi:alkylated DNA repair dioxygenase AlkB
MLMPEGFHYWPELVSKPEEICLLEAVSRLEFKPFEFKGFFGNRRIIAFGWRYDFNDGSLKRAAEIPDFLLPVRERAAKAAGVPSTAIEQAMVAEYPPGAAIGWHRDRSIFGEVIGVSLASQCTFRFRQRIGEKWDRASIILDPRSAYLLKGPVRTSWEHSIPAVAALRYSITFRTMKSKAGRGETLVSRLRIAAQFAAGSNGNSET